MTQHYQVFAYMIEMLLDHKLDSHRITIYSATLVSKCDAIVSTVFCKTLTFHDVL